MNQSMRKGFTLIELLIVVAVIGILASVILVGLRGFREAGRDSRRIQDLSRVRNGLELYFNRCRFYPGTANCALTTQPSAFGTGLGAGLASWNDLTAALTGTTGLNIDAVPQDPLFGAARSYGYGRTANGLRYLLLAVLEDKNNSALRDDVDSLPAAPNDFVGVPAASCDESPAAAPALYCITF